MNYYNEFDPKAAAWLRELIKEGHIAPGVVDERSIADLKPDDLHGFNQCHFFAGIGGWSFALRLAGVPDDAPVWTGSCPCQPFSNAGKRLGENDPRHLWPKWFQLIAECSPAIVFGEQVASKAGRDWFSRVRSGMETLGYAIGGCDLCAAGVGAPHIRQRLFWLGYAGCKRDELRGIAANLVYPASQKQIEASEWERGRDAASGSGDACGMEHTEGYGRKQWRAESIGRGFVHRCWDVYNLANCRDGKTRRFESGSFPLAHGVPSRVGLLRGYGNAIVPQLAAEFIQASIEAIGDACAD